MDCIATRRFLSPQTTLRALQFNLTAAKQATSSIKYQTENAEPDCAPFDLHALETTPALLQQVLFVSQAPPKPIVATMFFLYNLERQVTLHPSYFGRNMHELVTGKLLKDVEGTCTGRYYIITIMDTFNISEGRILPGSGLAEFTVGYRAVVWRPFKGETVR